MPDAPAPPPGASGSSLPDAPRAQGSYVPASAHRIDAGTVLIHTAGMTPRVDGELVARGRVGAELDAERGAELAGIAASNALAAIAARCGGLEAVTCLQMTVYVASAPGFEAHTQVADGASAALRERLGDRGAVARTAVGVAGLPSGAPVEVSLVAAASGRTP